MPTIAQVTASTLITAAKYNEIQTKIADVIVNDYGYSAASSSVDQYAVIDPNEWVALQYDIDRCKVHQTHAASTANSLISDVLSAIYVNALILSADESFNNRYTAHPNQLDSSSVTTSAPSGVWASNIDTFYHTWINDADSRHFFALGGTIAISLVPGTSTGLGALINEVNTALSTNSYSIADYTPVDSTKTWVSRSSGAGSVTVTSTLTHSAGPTQIITVVTVQAPESAPVTLDMNTTVTTYWSKDRGGDIPGFNAQPPEIVANDGGASAVRNLSVSPTTLNQYVWPAGTTSNAQTITLTNSGNVTLAISNIIYSSSGNVTAIPSPAYNWSTSPAVTIFPGDSYAFTLAYSGNSQAGPYSNTVTVKSNNDRGDIVINTTQQINQPILDIALSPDTTDSVAAPISLTRQFLITANRAAIPAYTASLSGNTGVFAITSPAAANPITVTFTPTNDTNTAAYSAVLTVTSTEPGSTSVTKTAIMSVNYSRPANANLGTWLSTAAQYNSIVGISYDRISGEQYLTVGIGTGADGGSPLTNTNVGNLGITADTNYSKTIGTALYRMRSYSGHIQFLKDYGVWIRPDLGDAASLDPVNSELSRSYTFTVPESKIYSWVFSVDDYAYFTIDGVIQGNLNTRNRGNPNYWNRTQTSTVYLASGTHTIKFYVTNAGSNAGIAIRLYDPALPSVPDYDIWSTLKPVRPYSPYPYWNQVFRIPLTGGANTYQLTREYCVKDTGPVSWSDYFNPFITITDNGSTNLGITFNQQYNNSDSTIVALPYSPYYYVNSADPAVGVRTVNLDDGIVNGVPGQTQFFTGFTVVRSAGNIVTSVIPATRLTQPYPGYGYVAPDPYVYVYDGGGGPSPE